MYGTARFKLDHLCALSREQYHIFLECMVRNSCFRLICSHDSKYHECYTLAPGVIPEFAREILTSTRYDYYEDYLQV